MVIHWILWAGVTRAFRRLRCECEARRGAGATAHWLFGADNQKYRDLASSQTLQKMATHPNIVQ